jgi:hypothetical protein
MQLAPRLRSHAHGAGRCVRRRGGSGRGAAQGWRPGARRVHREGARLLRPACTRNRVMAAVPVTDRSSSPWTRRAPAQSQPRHRRAGRGPHALPPGGARALSHRGGLVAAGGDLGAARPRRGHDGPGPPRAAAEHVRGPARTPAPMRSRAAPPLQVQRCRASQRPRQLAGLDAVAVRAWPRCASGAPCSADRQSVTCPRAVHRASRRPPCLLLTGRRWRAGAQSVRRVGDALFRCAFAAQRTDGAPAGSQPRWL